MDKILDPGVISSAITVLGALVGVILTYWLSKRKPTITLRRQPTSLNELSHNPHYQEYERIIKSQGAELDRLYDRNSLVEKRYTDLQVISDKRETDLRNEIDQLHALLTTKDREIGSLRHLREFTNAAKKITIDNDNHDKMRE